MKKKRLTHAVHFFKIEEKELIEKIDSINESQGFSRWVKEKLSNYEPKNEDKK